MSKKGRKKTSDCSVTEQRREGRPSGGGRRKEWMKRKRNKNYPSNDEDAIGT